ncbi:potassium channel family protein [Tepidibacter thalassicus]|uniref:Pentapeptide repeat-containing protein n=1 Tax=Tepidibacter thalassicus DSM 15285 TaxID=1123350 RepID=A0A1M5NT51_9FIRM|nr:potassium channel family protein [Tepidibacter thalassicus]SHG92133.1 Pentapeptide repeat-containing protein [Tepidibacter thalassicus DSM 15285]
MKCKWESKYDNIKCCRDAYDTSGYCLFHKPNKTKKENEIFNKIISEGIQSDLYIYNSKSGLLDFRGFVFCEEIKHFNFKNSIVNIKDNITFDFSEAVFKQNIYFDNYKFKGDVYFYNTEFEKVVSFKNCIFEGDCVFQKTKFKLVHNISPFYKANFVGQHLIFKDIENGPKFDGILFSQNTKFILDNVNYDKMNYLNGRNAYRIAKNQSNIIGDYYKVGRYYYKERWYNGKMIFPPVLFWDNNNKGIKKIAVFRSIKNEKHYKYVIPKLMDLTAKYVVGYGERPQNVLFLSFILISLFAYLYMIVGLKLNVYSTCSIDSQEIIKYNLVDFLRADIKQIFKDYFQAWYFSIVTFTTVGYGDFIPINFWGKILSSIEMFLGLTVVAAWTSTLVRKMSR